MERRELVAFNIYLGFLLYPIFTIGFLAAGISRAGASSLRVFEVLDAPLEVENAPDAVPLPPVRCRVAERGTHASLLATGGRYADLYRRQLREPAASPR